MENKNKTPTQYGIYLGNEFSGIAVNGKIITNERIKNQKIIPTIVSFNDERKDPIIGENINFQLSSNPKNTIYGFINLIGKKFSDPEVEEFKNKVKFKIKKKSENEDDIKIEFNFNKKICEESPEYFLQLIVKHLIKFDNKKHLPDFIYIITVPSSFNEIQKKLVENAINDINLKNFKIISEAQALVNNCTQINIFDNKLFVFCFDGNGVELSILENGELKENMKELVYGRDYFIKKLFDHCVEVFIRRTSQNFSDDKNKCDELNNSLTTQFNNLSLDNHRIFFEKTNFYKKENLKIEITKREFKTIFNDFFNKYQSSIENYIETKNITISNANYFIFNCSKMPYFEDFISKTFNLKKNQKQILDNKNYEIYPIGASLYKENDDNEGIEKPKDDEEDEEVQEIKGESPIKLSLGFDKGDGRMEFVIKKGEKKKFRQKGYYETRYDKQDSCEIKIYRGERFLVEDNIEIGSIKLSNLIRKPKGYIIIINFDYNLKDNSLTVIAYEKENDKNKQEIKKHPYSIPYNDMEVKLIKDPKIFKEEDKKKEKAFCNIEELKDNIVEFEEIINRYENESPALVGQIKTTLNSIQININYKNFDEYNNQFEKCQEIINEMENKSIIRKNQNDKEKEKKIQNLEKEKEELNKRVRVLQKTIKEIKWK